MPWTGIGAVTAEQVARKLTQSWVVKAFSSVGAEVMVDPRYPDGPAVLPVAGDDSGAKATALALAGISA